MRNIKLIIEYDGTNLSGWQLQTPDKRTVQGEIEHALRTIFKKTIRVIGSGRTDAGVHAVGQVANFKLASQMPVEEITRALNGNLPDDIVIIHAQEVSPGFHAQFSAKRKTYHYTIVNRAMRPILNRNFAWHIHRKINLSLIRKEANYLIGKHNFLSFTAVDHHQKKKLTIKDTIRTIHTLDIHKKNSLIIIKITANGFLYKMVRNIVGTLIEIGTGALPAGSIKKILKANSRNAAGITAPAKGLTLVNVVY